METNTGNGRWNHLNKLLTRTGPCADGSFEPSETLLSDIQKYCKILVVGAGGLGCELLKSLSLMGFLNMHVIDMDTIDLSNLNRQFLFRQSDIDKPKAEVAASFINKRIPGAQVVPHYKRIQDCDSDFYSQFGIVVCGLDSVVARRWINSVLVSLDVDPPNKQIPLIDGGTEGFKGNARIIIPGKSACIECTLNLYPPQVNFPLCTIAQTPRLPEHCIEYVRMMQWPAETPFGRDIDGDNPEHIQWIFEKALERGSQYGISGITYRLTQGVVKNIIPAVASTNAVIAAACATEVFKLVSGCAPIMNNYMVFNDADGIYAYTYEQEKKKDCMACSLESQIITLREESTLRELIDYLIESPVYQMRSPGVTMVTAEGRNKTLYMKTLREHTEANLSKSLKDLGVREGTEVNVTDVTSLLPCIFKIYFDSPMTS